MVVRQSYMPTTALISAHTPTRSLHCTRTTTTFSALRPNRKHVASSLLFIMKDHDGTSECSQDTIPDDPRHAAEHAPGLPRIPHPRSLATENSSSSMLKTLQRRVDLEPTNCISRVELGRALVACGRRTEGFESLAVAFELNSLCPGVKDGFREYYQAEIDVSFILVVVRVCAASRHASSSQDKHGQCCRCFSITRFLPPLSKTIHGGLHTR